MRYVQGNGRKRWDKSENSTESTSFVQQVLVFSESLVPTVRKALCDPLEEVREAAAKTFEQLHATIGHQALDDILPTLLKQLVSNTISPKVTV